ncbi:hypothetical protein F5880DRAFT_1734978 [Lentinula raphanica]|nr:hypothetical protein F5880DRAFT_1734978 [Lentinula raphanica]
MVSEWAVWSGYQINVDAFKSFIAVLLGTEDRPKPDKSIDAYVYDYVRWKNHLPRKEAAKSPKIRFHSADPESGRVTHIFFPIRFIPFTSERQFDDPTHPDYPIAHEETEKDKAKLERWLDYINTKNGGEHRIGADQFEFAVMEDLHPLAEWRVSTGSNFADFKRETAALFQRVWVRVFCRICVVEELQNLHLFAQWRAIQVLRRQEHRSASTFLSD